MKGGRFVAPLLLLGLAALLRWFPGASLSLGVDDGGSILTASPPLLEIFPRMLATHEVHPPLWFFWLHPWFAVLKPGAFEGSGGLEPWFRSSNVLWSLLVVVLTYALGERLGGRRVGLAAGLLAAVSNYLVFYALELRMYPMLTAFLLGAAWAAVAGRAVPLVVCCVLAFLSHYEAVFFIAALGLFCLTEPADARRRWVVPALVLGVAIAAWTPLVLRQAGGQAFTLRATPSWPQAVELLFELGLGVTWPSPLPGWDPGVAVPPVKWLGLAVLALLAVGLWRSPPRARRLLGLTIALPLAAVFAVSIFTPLRVFEYKYLQPTCPFVCIALAMWLRGGPDGEGRAPDGVAVVALLAAVNLAAWVGFARNADWYGPQDWRDVVPLVARALGPGEVVLVHPSMMAGPPIVYAALGEPRFFTAGGDLRIIPTDAAAAPQMLAALAGAPRALLLMTRHHPFVEQQRLLEHLPPPWEARLLGETSSYWPANRIQTFLLTRRPSP